MKKILSLILVAVMVISISTFAIVSSAATTGADVLNRIEKLIVDEYPGVYSQLKKVYNQVTITNNQAGQLMPLVDEFEAIYNAGKVSGYTAQQGVEVMDIFDRASQIIGFTYEWHNVDRATNPDLNPEIVTVSIVRDGKEIGSISGNKEIIHLGDVNEDGNVNSYDATLVLQKFAGIEVKGTFNNKNAEVEGNNEIDSVDATLILQFYGEMISSFPAEKL